MPVLSRRGQHARRSIGGLGHAAAITYPPFKLTRKLHLFEITETHTKREQAGDRSTGTKLHFCRLVLKRTRPCLLRLACSIRQRHVILQMTKYQLN
jgi:hypothetical protein